MVSSLYKILVKLLAHRLKECLPNLISHNQSAFIKEGQILDEVLVVNEPVDSRNKQRKPGLLLKADFEKAADHLS